MNPGILKQAGPGLVFAVCLSAGLMATAQTSNPAPAGSCKAESGAFKAQVVELYTSEGCSSCPPADKWLSTLKAGKAAAPTVVQAFHVGYWDYIGWVDRFATPAHTARQRQIASWNRQTSVYTPQLVLQGRDWRDWWSKPQLPAVQEPAGFKIVLQQTGPDQFEALVSPQSGNPTAGSPTAAKWSAYWTLTEDGHSSKVKAGENAGELLQHDFVVRQYTQAGDYAVSTQPQKLAWRSIAATPGHARRVNLVVFDPRTGQTLQAVSAPC